MYLARNVIQGAAGGLLAGAVVGVAEASWLLSANGAPDLLAPLYAAVLYGLVGLGLGLVGAVALSIFELVRSLGERGESIAFAVGAIAGAGPIGGFVLAYTLNKVVYGEQGLPGAAKAGLIGGELVFDVLALTLGVALLQGPLKVLRRGVGVLGLYGAILAATGVVAALPHGDGPRARFAVGKAVPAELASAPDVIVITVDTLRADHLGAYGRAGATPALDALAADGIVFEQAFVHASWTRSSFASLWTSRLPSSHNADTKGSMLPAEAELLSEVLQAKGVTTGMLANNINVSSTFGFDQGYDAFVYEAPDYAFGATESVFGLTLYKVVHKLHERLLHGSRRVESFYQPADVVLADAKAFLEANAGGRVFLGVHLMEPHDPYFAHPYLDGTGTEAYSGEAYGRAEHEHPDPADAERLKKLYLDEVRHLDHELAPFLDWLRSTGRYDRTMIVVTADHGEEFGEHGGFWHGTTLYDEQIHVPLIVKLPGGDLAGTRVPWQVRSLDVAPTIATAVGVPVSAQWQGSDLLGDVRAAAAEAAARADALAAEAAAAEAAAAAGVEAPQVPSDVAPGAVAVGVQELTDSVDPCDRYHPPHERVVVAEEDFEGNVLSAIRSGGFKLTIANAGNPRGLATTTLFDVIDDPAETKDLAASPDVRCGAPLKDLPGTLGDELKRVVEAAAAGKVEGGEAKVGDTEKCRLCALGYLSGADCDACK